MRPGQILVADHAGVYVIKMVGDVRLTLCISFDQFIDTMFSRDDFCDVMFDLSEAEAIDSTTLGLMAKIALQGREEKGITPVIFSNNDSINRLLQTMGFQEIFTIVSDLEAPVQPEQPLAMDATEEQQVKEKVIEAHKILMGLNQDNRETFRNLVKMLEER
ncbi:MULTISPECIES: STAS domain-containing protein [Marinimicrobium]|jgi:anti-anti-sigma factor|uniref:Anti-anti-sigma factor n=1 Tax=Marinimicrobium koreense TaxID=306545 RepID=A0A3N1NYZ7_9GAMM|nr:MULTISPECIES: STAS domain-containing protein [Marinimicrobium]MAN53243.1 anti-sigma factor antagonist [Marinimicrobium sp.]ROQ19630.1 anti-anti-sigma factor [Marinimicrobium koreense]|tara:strand:+ start:915 stop:1397 length:483 start_codon:yes stop_codon:yes gene_type:complete